jgi:hypothetical protein
VPLRDHFHAPLYPTRSWESFHSRWANAIGDYLNGILPRRYVSEIQIHFGAEVAADVAELEQVAAAGEDEGNGTPSNGGLAVRTWAPPAVTVTLPIEFPDDLEIQVVDLLDGSRLVAVVELVSLRNKDRPAARRHFAAKTAAYLQRGIGVVVADIVTSSRFNLHHDLVDLLELADSARLPRDPPVYAIAYRPVHRDKCDVVDIWTYTLSVGTNLPIVPLALKGAETVPLDLEGTYSTACERARL